jgi:hypothetical protein
LITLRLLVCLTLFPTLLWSHGAEFIGAKLTVLPTRELTLELTADYGGNPMLANRDEAQQVLQSLLLLEFHSAKHALQDLAPFAFEDRTAPDASSPLPTDNSGAPHQLLTAIWRWHPPPQATEVRFHSPNASKHDAVFWIEEKEMPPEKKKWAMLLGGDQTPAIPLPRVATSPSRSSVVFVAILSFAIALILFLIRLRTRRS